MKYLPVAILEFLYEVLCLPVGWSAVRARRAQIVHLLLQGLVRGAQALVVGDDLALLEPRSLQVRLSVWELCVGIPGKYSQLVVERLFHHDNM